MSDHIPAASGGSNRRRNPWVTPLLNLAGIMLLLPGLCTLIIFVMLIRGEPGYRMSYNDSAVLLLAGLVIGAAGMGVIVFAIRR